jgi:hypothetical protein
MSIGHFLLTITPAEEERVLTSHLGSVMQSRCLLQTMSGQHCALPGTRHFIEAVHAHGAQTRNYVLWGRNLNITRRHHVGYQYDMLVDRFGLARVARAIRNRILANQARRVLAQIEAAVHA